VNPGPNNTATNSASATNNYIKALQDKIKSLQQENEDVKKSFIDVSELLEKERSDFQTKLIREVNNTLENEKSLKRDIEELMADNRLLSENYNELKVKLSLLNTNVNLLENEKERHLEQNAMDKQNLQEEIQNLMQMGDDDKRRLLNLNNENGMLRQQLAKVCKIIT
jgi:chromosome segregation ATPase